MPIFATIDIFLFPVTTPLTFAFRITAIAISLFSFFHFTELQLIFASRFLFAIPALFFVFRHEAFLLCLFTRQP